MSKKAGQGRDVPGNTLASQAAFTEGMVKASAQILRADKIIERCDDADIFIRAIKLMPPTDGRTDWLVVVSADSPDGRLVAFTGALDCLEALRGCFAKMENKSMKWRQDTWPGTKNEKE